MYGCLFHTYFKDLISRLKSSGLLFFNYCDSVYFLCGLIFWVLCLFSSVAHTFAVHEHPKRICVCP